MAFYQDNKRSPRPQGGYYGGQQSGRDFGSSRDAALPKPVQPLELPEDYVDAAEKCIRKLAEERDKITSSKLRGIYAMVTDLYNPETLSDKAVLSAESQSGLMRLRVHLVYDAGREATVLRFVEEGKLLEYLKGIGTDRAKFLRFAHYMEALVAYHMYYIGSKERRK